MNIGLSFGSAMRCVQQYRGPFLLVEGPAGTGKTRFILTLLLMRAFRYPNSRILLTRQTRTSLTQSVLVTLEQEVFPVLHQEVPGGAGRQNRSEYPLKNGSVLVPIGQDSPEALYSTAWDGIYCAEAIEMEHDATQKLARGMRGTAWPFQQLIADTNPGPPTHWLNEIAQPFKGRRRVETRNEYRELQRFNAAPVPEPTTTADARPWKRIITRHQDNPGYWDSTAWDWTIRGRRYADKLRSLSGHVRRRLWDGEWVAAAGSIYPEFDEAKHVIDPIDSGEWPVWIGWDPGYDHPTAILWVTRRPEDGAVIVFDEIYAGGKGVAQHAADVHARNYGRNVQQTMGDPQYAFSRTAFNPVTIAEQCRACGIPMVPWPRTGQGEASMIEAVRALLIGGRLLVTRNCRNTINEFQAWRWKRTAAGALGPGQDCPEDKNNHCLGAGTMVWTSAGKAPICNLMGLEGTLKTPWGWSEYRDVHQSGWKQVFLWTFSNGTKLTATKEHRIMMENGSWKQLGLIQRHELIYCGDENRDYYHNTARLQRESVLQVEGEAVFPEADKPARERASASGGVGVPQWRDPYENARPPQGPRHEQQLDRESATDGCSGALEEPHDAGAPGVVCEERCRNRGTCGQGLAQRGGWEGVAFCPRQGSNETSSGGGPDRFVPGVREGIPGEMRTASEILQREMQLASARTTETCTLESVEDLGRQMTYDLNVEGWHAFSVNGGLCVSNSMDVLKGLIAAGVASGRATEVQSSEPDRRQRDSDNEDDSYDDGPVGSGVRVRV